MKRIPSTFLALILTGFLCLALPGETMAARFHVFSAGIRESGPSVPGDWSSENCYDTLANALLNAEPADSLLLYNEDHVVSYPLVLTSFLANQNLDTNHVDCRILLTDTAQLDPDTHVAHSAIRGISFVGLEPVSGRPALLISNPLEMVESISLSSCLFQNNHGSLSDSRGGSCICAKWDGHGLELLIEDCVFEGNSSIGAGGAFYANHGYTVTIEGSEFRDNAIVDGYPYYGGAITVESTQNLSTLTVSDSIFEDNISQGRGGAINIVSGNLFLNNCDILGNFSNSSGYSNQYQGPGVCVRRWPDVHDDIQVGITDCRFIGNTAKIMDTYYAGGDGGGLHVAGTDNTHRTILQVSNSLFEDNYNVQGAGMYIGRYSTAVIDRTVFCNNTALAHGGAAYKGGQDPPSEGETGRFEYCLFYDNEAGYDEAGVPSSEPYFGQGGALMCRVYPRIEVLNCTFMNNRAGGPEMEGDAIYHTSGPESFTNDLRKCVLVNSLFYGTVGNDVQIRSGAAPGGFSLVDHCAYMEGEFQCEDVTPTATVFLETNPFAGSYDFHLLSDSPCVDAGTDLGLSPDIEGISVPQGGWPDIGAFEFLDPVAIGEPDYQPLPEPGLLHVLDVAPNPFNPSTTISYSLDAPGHTTLAVFDVSGCLVKILVDETMNAGLNSATWNGLDQTGKRVASGTYFLRLETHQGVSTRKVVLAK